MKDIAALKEFLGIPFENPDGVFAKFSGLPGAITRGQRPRRFVYMPGSRKDRVLLVAHADTVWDDARVARTERGNEAIRRGGIFLSNNPRACLGADDRAGCAMLWLLRDLGHSLLVTDGEGSGRQGSAWLMQDTLNLCQSWLAEEGLPRFER